MMQSGKAVPNQYFCRFLEPSYAFPCDFLP